MINKININNRDTLNKGKGYNVMGNKYKQK